MKTRQERPGEILPFLVVSDDDGNIFEVEECWMTGSSGGRLLLPAREELISLPYGSNLFVLPGRIPIGWDYRKSRFRELPRYRGKRVHAVAAFMAPAYLQHLTASWRKTPDAKPLSMYCYTAVGWREGYFFVPASRVDEDTSQDLANMVEKEIAEAARRCLKRHEGEPARPPSHGELRREVLLPRGPESRDGPLEAPIPTSPFCNARCLGCISRQPGESGFPSSQDRLDFVPTVEEILAFAVPHLEKAERAVVSFGQGCEGEPLMVGETLIKAVRGMRERTGRGVINLNTNASFPDVIAELCDAGLDSVRVSLNSAREKLYTTYYDPKGYTWNDVVRSIAVARSKGIWISLNYFMFPGLTDTREEMAALETLVREYRIDMIQTRNLNLDPEPYMTRMGCRSPHLIWPAEEPRLAANLESAWRTGSPGPAPLSHG
jgi:pyruvate-formate lyase-activating enzyme